MTSPNHSNRSTQSPDGKSKNHDIKLSFNHPDNELAQHETGYDQITHHTLLNGTPPEELHRKHHLRPHNKKTIMQLQRTLGNYATLRLLDNQSSTLPPLPQVHPHHFSIQRKDIETEWGIIDVKPDENYKAELFKWSKEDNGEDRIKTLLAKIDDDAEIENAAKYYTRQALKWAQRKEDFEGAMNYIYDLDDMKEKIDEFSQDEDRDELLSGLLRYLEHRLEENAESAIRYVNAVKAYEVEPHSNTSTKDPDYFSDDPLINDKFSLEPLLDYEPVRTLEFNAQRTIKLAKHKETGKQVVIKIMNKAYIDIEEKEEEQKVKQLANEKEIQDKLSSYREQEGFSTAPILRLINHSEGFYHIYFILEFAAGGDLEAKMKAGQLSDLQAKMVMINTIRALKLMHELGMVHRDIKPENIMYLDEAHEIPVLADFGLSGFNDVNGGTQQAIGNRVYAAPEVLYAFVMKKENAEFDALKADVWMLGTLLYEVFTGKLPYKTDPLKFQAEGDDHIYQEVQKLQAGITFPNTVDEGLQDLIKMMLKYKPQDRPSMAEITEHEVFKSVLEK